LAAGGGTGFSGLAGAVGAEGAEGFSAVAGFASSSAMIRRIDARISSIEGSWTFAGCVISDSTSSTLSSAFYTKRGRKCRFGIGGFGFSSRQPHLSPDQASRDVSLIASLPGAPKRRATTGPKWRESLSCPRERYVRATNDCKQRRDERSPEVGVAGKQCGDM